MSLRLEVLPLNTFWERWRGARAFTAALQPPLYFPRCRSVHTFGMRYDLHLLWLDASQRIVKIDCGVSPGQIKSCAAAQAVIELPAVNAAPAYQVGQKLGLVFRANRPVKSFFRVPGQALVEAALVMPMLFLLLFGFIELGLLLHAQQRLNYVVQQATQVGALTNNDAKVSGVVEAHYAAEAVQLAIENVSRTTQAAITSTERRYGDTLRVQLAQPYRLHIPFLPFEVFNVQAQASARVLCQNVSNPYQCQ